MNKSKDPIYEKQRIGLNMYLEAILEDIQRSIPDIKYVGGVIQMQLKEVKDYLDSAPRRRNLRGKDLDNLKRIYQLTEANYKKRQLKISRV